MNRDKWDEEMKEVIRKKVEGRRKKKKEKRKNFSTKITKRHEFNRRHLQKQQVQVERR